MVGGAVGDVAASHIVFGQLWSIECGTKPLKGGLSSSATENFHYSGLSGATTSPSRIKDVNFERLLVGYADI